VQVNNHAIQNLFCSKALTLYIELSKEMVKMQVRWENIPPENDFEAMRKWNKTEFHTYNRTPQCTPLRNPVHVATRDEEIWYRDNEKFGIRVYIPQGKSEGLLPALVTYHGGGWVHGDAKCDEGLLHHLLSLIQ
jgi:acetyl esterase/lipase